MRKAYVTIKLPEELMDYVVYVVTRRLLGYRTLIEFVSSAVRKEILRLRRLNIVPPMVPKAREVPAGAIGVLSAVLLVALVSLLVILPGSPTGLGVWDDVFRPLAGWDIAGVYARYQGFINFTLYFVSFFAIVFSTIKKWLDTREAAALSVAIALALSTGLALVPVNWLRQLSPVALLVLALVLFYAVFESLRRFGFAWVSSGSLAYVLSYLLLRTHKPDLFVAAGAFGSVLSLAFFVAFAVALFKIASELWGKSEIGFAKAGHAARLAWGQAFGSSAERALVAEEQEDLSAIVKIEPAEEKRLAQVHRELDQVEQAIRKFGYSREAMASIAHELGKLRGQESELARDLGALEQLAERVRTADVTMFTRLQKQFEKLSPERKAAVKKAIEEKVAALNLEAQLPRLAESARSVQAQSDGAIREAIALLERNQPHDALRWLDRARYYTTQLGGLLRQVEETEQAISALTNQSLRYFTK